MSFKCPNCGEPVGFGEAICPNCKADVTSLWEQNTPKKEAPKVPPGMGGMNPDQQSAPFPPPASSPFPPPTGGSPFPPPTQDQQQEPSQPSAPASSPFPPPTGGSPFPPPTSSAPFPPPADSAPFPPPTEQQPQEGPYLEIPRIGGKIYIKEGTMHIGRDEIQGCATIALPDMNAYRNISRVKRDAQGNIYSEHFILHNENGKVTIEDQHSTNGTYLGAKKLQGLPPQPLKEGDKIILPIEENGKLVQLEIIFHEK